MSVTMPFILPASSFPWRRTANNTAQDNHRNAGKRLDAPPLSYRIPILAESGVVGVHDLHVWMIAWGDVALSGHVVSSESSPDILHRLCALVRQRTVITHITLQVEPPDFLEAETHV